MVRCARDIEEITAEIMCSEFAFDTLIAMSQMEIPTQADQQQKLYMMAQQLQQIQQQAMQQMQQAQAAPGAQAMATQQSPDQMKELEKQYKQLKGNIEDEQQKPTIEDVEQFIRDYRTTAFVLDIETDSTIQADENAEKQRRGEFMQMMASLLPQLGALIAAEPGAAEFCGELLKFSVAPFRVGRTLDGSIDNLVEQIEMKASERQGKPDPKLEAEQKKLEAQGQIEMKKIEAQAAEAQGRQQLEVMKLQGTQKIETDKMQGEFRIAMFEAESKRQENMAKVQQIQAKGQMDAAKHQQQLVEGNQKMALNTQLSQQKAQDAQNRSADMAARRQLNERGQLFKEKQAAMKPYPTTGAA
jgi:hypothetical protein